MIDTRRLRCVIGWLGMILPWIVLVLSLAFTGVFPDSISATWYLQECVTPFMVILGAAGILLICYNGYDRQDRVICTLSGIFGLLICLFPCNPSGFNSHWEMISYPQLVGTFHISPSISGQIHNLSAICFFGLLAYNSLFLFTKSGGIMTQHKKIRNRIFRICGIGMVASLALIVPVTICGRHHIPVWGAVWAIETLALGFFGISWLTKANCYKWLFCD